MNEKTIAALNSARMLAATDAVIIPVLQGMINAQMNMAAAKFRGGEKDFVAEVAYIAALQDLELQLRKIQQKGVQAQMKLDQGDE